MFGTRKPAEPLPHFEDGTNVLVGTDYFYHELCTSDWFVPSDSVSTSRWREKLQRIQEQFYFIARNYRPQPALMVQSRVPAFGEKPDPMVWIEGEENWHSGGGGLERDVCFLTDENGHQLFCNFPIMDAEGKAIVNSAGEAFAIRFGLSRMHFLYRGPNYVHESRPLPGPQLSDVARDASGILFGLPSSISSMIWKNWKSGFSRRICERMWFDALFEVAWQHPEGSSLVADRHAWPGHTAVQLDGDGLFPRISESWLGFGTFGSIPQEYGYPLCFYSKLDDLARASVSMIDVLLELPDQPEEKSPQKHADSNQKTYASATVPSTGSTRDQVFVSYSRKDKKFLDELHSHLKPFMRDGGLNVWSDEKIAPGSEWFEDIKTALSKSKVAVLLVTPQFLASDFIHEHELGPLLKDAATGGVIILWVLVRECSFEKTTLVNYQAVVSPPDRPLAQMKETRDAAWKRVCQEIKKAFNS